MAHDTRTRMLDAAVTALRRQGVAGMSFTDVLADSGAARGAIYHHFPGGKAQLVAEAADRHGDAVRAALDALPGATPAEVVGAFVDAVGPIVAESADGKGCAIAAVTVGDARLREVGGGVFAGWVGALADRLCTAGSPPAEAHDLAVALIGLLEGAQVLCRAAGDTAPWGSVAAVARRLAG